MTPTTTPVRNVPAVFARAVVVLAVACVGCIGATSHSVPRAMAADARYALLQEPDAGYGAIISLIGNASRSVRVTMYELTDPSAVNALIDAHRRGVDTRVILDEAFHGHKTNAEAFQELSDAGVGVRWASAGVIYHQKTITVANATAAVGTGNLTPQYYPTSRDAWVLDTDPADVAAIAATFDTDYTAPPSGRPPEATPAPQLVWSPAARAPPAASTSAARNSRTAPSSALWTPQHAGE
jgi:cardiolipin synthase